MQSKKKRKKYDPDPALFRKTFLVVKLKPRSDNTWKNKYGKIIINNNRATTYYKGSYLDLIDWTWFLSF